MRLPRPVRRLVVAHQQEWARPVALLKPAQRVVGHDVGGVAGNHLVLGHLHHLGVVVASLAGEHRPVVEPGRPVRFALPQVPLADVRGLVAGGLQQLREGLQAVVHHGGERGDTVHVVVGAGQDRGPAWRADRVGAEAVVEPHPAGGDAVEMGGAIDAAAVAAHGMRRMVVAHDEQNVGRAAHDPRVIRAREEEVAETGARAWEVLSTARRRRVYARLSSALRCCATSLVQASCHASNSDGLTR